MKYLKTYENNIEYDNYYYAIKWYQPSNDEFVEPEGNFDKLDDVLDYIGSFVSFSSSVVGGEENFLKLYNKEFKIVKIYENELNVEDIKLHFTTKKFNI